MKRSMCKATLLLLALLLALSLPLQGRARAAGVTGSSGEAAVFSYLHDTMGLNEAACCGVLANIEAESGFSWSTYGDMVEGSATSFGICQWHYERWDRLKSYCARLGLNENTLNAQLRYLQYELETYYTSTLNYLRGVANTADGAYDAGYHWCYYFENPANRAEKAAARGSRAANEYWTVYQPSGPEFHVEFTETEAFGYQRVTAGTANLRLSPVQADGNVQGTVSGGTVLYVSALCTNSDGEQFYRIYSGSRAGCYISATVVEPAGEVEDAISVTGLTFPTHHIVGTGFTVAGTFTSSISGICYVSVQILDAEGNSTGVGKTVTVNRMEYSLLALDPYVKFGQIQEPGMYLYRVEVRNASSTYLLEKPFEIAPVQTVEVTFVPNGGVCDVTGKTVYFGGRYGELPTPQREGLVFSGWYTEADGGKAVDASSRVEASDAVTLYAHWSIPAPADLSAESREDGSIAFRWSRSPGAEGWMVYYRLDGYSAWKEYQAVTEPSCVLTGLENASRYELSLRSYWTQNGERSYSSERSAVVRAVSLKTPAAPGRPQAEREGDAVTVSWPRVSGATGYEVQISAGGGDWRTRDGIKDNSCSLNDLDDTLSYRFRVRAVSSSYGETRQSGYSAETELGPKPIAPSPDSLRAESLADGTVRLSWKKSDGADGYRVLYRFAGEEKWQEGDYLSGTETVVSGLTDRSSYEFAVLACTNINRTPTAASTPSQPAACVVFRAPDPPQGLRAARRDGGAVHISWDAAADAESYTLYYSVDGGRWHTVEGIREPGYTLSSAREAYGYAFKVSACGSYAGVTRAGTPGSEVQVAAKPVAPPPGALRLTSEDDGTVSAAWDKVSGADGYCLYYREVQYDADGLETGYGPWVSCEPTSAARLLVTELEAGANYQFRVCSYTLVDRQRAFSKDYSPIESAPSLPRPEPVEGVWAENAAGGALHLGWSAAERAESYSLRYSVDGGAPVTVDGLPDPEYTLTGLEPGMELRISVAATAGAFGVEKHGEKSEEVVVTMGASKKACPESGGMTLRASAGNDGSVRLSWDPLDGAESYRLYYAPILSPEGAELRYGTLAWADTPETGLEIAGLAPRQAYVFFLRAVVTDGLEQIVSAVPSAPTEAASLPQPAAPAGLKAERLEGDRVLVTWSPADDADEYELQFSDDGVNWTAVKGIDGTSWTLEELSPEQRCHLRLRSVIRCRSFSSFSPFGNSLLLRAEGDPTAWLKALPLDDGRIELTWETTAAADGYRVYYRRVADAEGALEDEDPWSMSDYLTADRLTLEGLIPGCVYEISVSAYREMGGMKDLIQEYKAFIRAPSLLCPRTPENVTARWTDHGTLLVSWDEVEGANRYVVAFSFDGENWQRAITPGECSCEFAGPEAGVHCVVRVWACVNLQGFSKQSDFAQADAVLTQ